MRAFKYVNDPKAFELVTDETRRRIIHLLRAREMSVSEIARDLEKTTPTIYHHIRKLIDGGFVEVSREDRVDHLIETYYRSTAEIFEFVHGGGTEEYEKTKAREGLKALNTIGLNIQFDEETIAKIVGLQKQIGTIGRKPEFEDRISKLENLDIMTKQEAYKYAQLATMSDKQFEESLSIQRQLRELVRSSQFGNRNPETKTRPKRSHGRKEQLVR